MWLTNLKIAIIQKNTDELNTLLDEMPQFDNKQDMQEAMYLLREATESVYKLQEETKRSMQQLKKSMNFLNSIEHETSNSLDIES